MSDERGSSSSNPSIPASLVQQVIAEMNEALQSGALFNPEMFGSMLRGNDNPILRWRDKLDDLAALLAGVSSPHVQEKEAALDEAKAPRQEVKPGLCGLCGEPMPPGEEMFKYHGFSGPCPSPPLELTAAGAKGDLRPLLRRVRAAINPPDVGGISLHEWNARLKAATAEIDAALDEII